MHIWVDADACPAVIKDILYRAAQRRGIPLTLVANQPLQTPPSPLIHSLRVRQGFDVADRHIAAHLQPGDLVITADIPLAAEVIAKGGDAINPRGERYTPDNIRERLAVRNFMEELRGAGVATGGPPPWAWPSARPSPMPSTASWPSDGPRRFSHDRRHHPRQRRFHVLWLGLW